MKKVSANDLKIGDIIEHEKNFYCVLTLEHTKPGKGGAFIKTDLRSIDNPTVKLSTRFRSTEKIEVMFVEEVNCQYLYADNDIVALMDKDNNFIELPIDMLGKKIALLQEGMQVTVISFEDKPVSVNLPKHITVTVTYADPAIKKQTASSSFKSATIQGDIRVQVPPFVEKDDAIIIASEDFSYISRAKKDKS